MQIASSCTAALELLRREGVTYIPGNDEASLQGLNRQDKETTHVALAHPHDPRVPGLSTQCQ
jgi:hypothetical protein